LNVGRTLDLCQHGLTLDALASLRSSPHVCPPFQNDLGQLQLLVMNCTASSDGSGTKSVILVQTRLTGRRMSLLWTEMPSTRRSPSYILVLACHLHVKVISHTVTNLCCRLQNPSSAPSTTRWPADQLLPISSLCPPFPEPRSASHTYRTQPGATTAPPPPGASTGIAPTAPTLLTVRVPPRRGSSASINCLTQCPGLRGRELVGVKLSVLYD
jgi:hypothetical protein